MLRLLPIFFFWVLLQQGGAQTAPFPTRNRYNAELDGLRYPFSVKTYRFTAQGQPLKMAYMDIPAQGAEKGVFVLLHGKNFGGNYFARLASELAGAGFRVVMPDQIGFGKSSKPVQFQYTFQALASFTDGLLTSLGLPKFRLLGHSMGGMIAVRFSLMFPEKVEKLVLVNPLGLEDWKTRTVYHTVDEWEAAELKQTPQTLKAYQQENYFGGNWKPAYDVLLAASVGWINGPDRKRIARTSALTSDMIFTQPVLYEFPLLKPKTVLFIGQRDRTALGKAWASPQNQLKLGDYPTLGREAARQIPNAKLVELGGVGHIPFIENFPQFWNAFAAAL